MEELHYQKGFSCAKASDFSHMEVREVLSVLNCVVGSECPREQEAHCDQATGCVKQSATAEEEDCVRNLIQV